MNESFPEKQTRPKKTILESRFFPIIFSFFFTSMYYASVLTVSHFGDEPPLGALAFIFITIADIFINIPLYLLGPFIIFAIGLGDIFIFQILWVFFISFVIGLILQKAMKIRLW